MTSSLSPKKSAKSEKQTEYFGASIAYWPMRSLLPSSTSNFTKFCLKKLLNLITADAVSPRPPEDLADIFSPP